MDAALAQLAKAYPLAPRWGKPSLYADRASIGGVSIWMCGLVVRDDAGRQATGSAAGLEEAQLVRAYFELLERSSILDAAERATFELLNAAGQVIEHTSAAVVFPLSEDESQIRYSRSNGVAAAQTFSLACEAAWLELVERDRVLAAWYGELEPRRVVFETPPALEGILELYELSAYAFDGDDALSRVRAVFAFPRIASAPLSYGFAARAKATDALVAATGECVQRLAFLWGEPIPVAEPSFAPTPEFHQDFFLRPSSHSLLRAWLSGEHFERRVTVSRSASTCAPRFVDLTPGHLAHQLSVVRALPSRELPLVFGRGHPALRGPIAAELMVHPIP